LFPPGDAHALAASVRRLAGDASLRRRLVEAGQSTARALTADTTVRELEAWHAKAITASSL